MSDDASLDGKLEGKTSSFAELALKAPADADFRQPDGSVATDMSLEELALVDSHGVAKGTRRPPLPLATPGVHTHTLLHAWRLCSRCKRSPARSFSLCDAVGGMRLLLPPTAGANHMACAVRSYRCLDH
jgi:hypothetical protein